MIQSLKFSVLFALCKNDGADACSRHNSCNREDHITGLGAAVAVVGLGRVRIGDIIRCGLGLVGILDALGLCLVVSRIR